MPSVLVFAKNAHRVTVTVVLCERQRA